MAAKKETTKKKDTATKKKAAPKKPAAKKTVKQIIEEDNTKVVDLTNATTEEVVKAFEEIDDVIQNDIAEIVETAEPKEELEVENGDPAVLSPKEEEPEKENKVVDKEETGTKKIIKRISKSFGYFWNGQMIDF